MEVAGIQSLSKGMCFFDIQSRGIQLVFIEEEDGS